MVIKRVVPLSAAKITATLYAIIGLIIGACFSLISVVTTVANPSGQNLPSAIFGVASIVIFPVLYGVLGFLGTLVSAWLYNLLAGALGGVEIEVQ